VHTQAERGELGKLAGNARGASAEILGGWIILPRNNLERYAARLFPVIRWQLVLAQEAVRQGA